MKKRILRMIICLAAIGLLACARQHPGPDFQPMDVEQLHQSSNCGGTADTPMALWIDDHRRLQTTLKQLNRGRMKKDMPEWAGDFDFSGHAILFVQMGQRPTAGFSLELIPDRAFVSGRSATVVLKWIRPAADATVAQVITSPCIWLKMPKKSFSTIKILDQAGRLKAEVRFARDSG